ncbi:carbohydrate ABC transporter permease [Paenibacillus thalictri]|uniref:Sugar ABC transporter permease n=1 Tax=Paenibacillus thalictri TaxID=2527873 RepID=A0A4V2J4U8_9BACL|nr:sugar ABC transporter permease [Paenibacillus thalictri]TBL81252.1 sugar ABC transporter permease [Paenibacillus thalictri]
MDVTVSDRKKTSSYAKGRIAKLVPEYGWALLFSLPALCFYVAIILLPLLVSVQLSLFNWDGMMPSMDFVGFSNYVHLWSEPRFLASLLRTLIWWVLHVVFAVGGGLVMALLIAQVRWGQSIFRTLCFLPHVLSLSVVGIIWAQLYHPNIGFINLTLKQLGLGFLAKTWLGDTSLVLTSISVASSWQAYGFYMVIFLAGLQNIDPLLYEASVVDGASPWQKFRYITLPSLRNTLTLVLSLAFISSLKGFGTVWAMTGGGPNNASELVAVYVWRDAFQSSEIGKASAAALTLGIAVIVLTVLFNQWRDRKGE